MRTISNLAVGFAFGMLASHHAIEGEWLYMTVALIGLGGYILHLYSDYETRRV